jgi:8-oxo-dGTP pyrophosphatase MutT (NUDIX family)
MEAERRRPHEPLNLEGEPVKPRQAATVLVLRGGAEALEVLLVQRNPQQRFMGGAWVFPGGAVDAEDGDDSLAHRAAGLREVQEEAGVTLPGPDALLPYSRWITPRQIAVRFDTHFFLARAPDDADPRVDGSECVGWGWYAPADALAAYERDELLLAFPTIKTLEGLAGFASADELLEWARGRTVEPVEPKVVVEGEVARVLLPGDPGYAG